jgi:hypothetical protein
MEIVVDQEVPIARAHLAALLDLRYSQQHYIANPPYDFYVFPDVIEREQEQVRTKAELCGIDIPESIDPLQWITSQDVRDHVSYLYVLALRNPKVPNRQVLSPTESSEQQSVAPVAVELEQSSGSKRSKAIDEAKKERNDWLLKQRGDGHHAVHTEKELSDMLAKKCTEETEWSHIEPRSIASALREAYTRQKGRPWPFDGRGKRKSAKKPKARNTRKR